MVSKCANPACSTPFLYLHEGKLFRVERPDGAGGPDFGAGPERRKSPGRHIEFFWLCDHCAASLTVVFHEEKGMQVIPKLRTQSAA